MCKALLWLSWRLKERRFVEEQSRLTTVGRGLKRSVLNEQHNSSEASGLVMWPEALHFALQLLRRLVSWILDKTLKLFKKLFNRPHKLTISLTRERTVESAVTVRDKITVEVAGDVALGNPWDSHRKGEDVKQLVKSLSDAGLL